MHNFQDTMTTRKAFYVLLLFLLLVGKSHAYAKNTSESPPCNLTFAWTDWPPFMVSSREQPSGAQLELVRWIGEEMNCEIIFQKMNWADSIQSIKSGKVDILGRASKIPARESYAYFSTPYREDLLVLTIRKGDAAKYKFGTLQQMFDHGFKLGFLKGGYIGDDIESFRSNPKYIDNFVEFDLEADILEGLDKKLIDGIFEAPFTVDNALMNNPLYSNFEEYPLEMLIGNLYFMFSKASVSSSLVERFNEAMIKVKQSNRYRQHWFWSNVQ